MQPAQMLPNALDDAMLAEQRPAVRALLIGRLEGMWSEAEGSLDAGKDRVRWAELQLRIVDRLAKLYRLDEVAATEAEETDAGADQDRLRRSVMMQLDDLAARG